MKLNKNFITHDTDGEQIIEAVYEKYDAPKEMIEQDVRKIIGTLKGIGAIDG